jgi:hypothetical protein
MHCNNMLTATIQVHTNFTDHYKITVFTVLIPVSNIHQVREIPFMYNNIKW